MNLTVNIQTVFQQTVTVHVYSAFCRTSFGATAPPFIDYLKDILQRYPDGGQILKVIVCHLLYLKVYLFIYTILTLKNVIYINHTTKYCVFDTQQVL